MFVVSQNQDDLSTSIYCVFDVMKPVIFYRVVLKEYVLSI